jgi:NAD(P)H-quinone oxidoreductase subunit 4
MCRRVFFGPRIPALATLGDMNPRELTIALVLVVPTLMIGFWPRLASGIYDATTDAISAQIHSSLVALLEMSSAIG